MTARRAMAESVSVPADIAVAASHAAKRASRGYFADDEAIEIGEVLSTARRGLTVSARRVAVEIDEKPRHLSLAPSRGYLEEDEIFGLGDSERLKRLRVDEDTVILKRIVPPTTHVRPVEENKRTSRVRRVMAPLGVAAVISIAAYGGINANLAAANERTEAPIAPVTASAQPVTLANVNQPAESVLDGLKVDSAAPVDNAAAIAADEARKAEEERVAEEQRQILAAQKSTVSTPKGSIAAPANAAGYAYPLTSYTFTSPYGYRVSPISYTGELHDGIDLAISCGTPVYASKGGTVVSAQWDGGFGWRVMIAHADGITTGYAHLSSMAVSTGQSVVQGQEIGSVGSTGASTGCHLHFMSQTPSGTFDPLSILG